MDWAADLEHLQAVLKKFNLVAAPNQEVLIQYFQEDLQLSIQALIDSWHQELEFQDKMLVKAIKAKSKAALKSSTSIQKIDTCCQKGRKLDKKQKLFTSHKEEKAKPADSQATTLAGTQVFDSNPQRNRKNCRNRQSGQATVNTLATNANLVDTTPTHNSGGS